MEILRKFISLLSGKKYSLLQSIQRLVAASMQYVYFLTYLGNKEKAYKALKNNYYFISYENYINKTKEKALNNLKTLYLRNNRWNFNGIFIPYTEDQDILNSMLEIYNETLLIYCEYDDNYNPKTLNQLDNFFFRKDFSYDGPYCYKDLETDITIKQSDIIIDVGSWIGDFSAYASKKGGYVYAFEPNPNIIPILKKTAEYNGNISVLPFGLSNKKCKSKFSLNKGYSLGGNVSKNGSIEVQLITLDDWAKENSITGISFIKADIEGFERNMLQGSIGILKTQSPKLSICTYHYKDDPKILREIILSANPNYRIIQRRKKLFAYVPSL
jgi:FkbM family methyltransferase